MDDCIDAFKWPPLWIFYEYKDELNSYWNIICMDAVSSMLYLSREDLKKSILKPIHFTWNNSSYQCFKT